MLNESAIEEYQIILKRNPTAKVFAPLAEAYRKIGLLQQALEICVKGTKHNPGYSSGFVAYGRILFELSKYEEALTQFDKASRIQPDGILSRKLKALCHEKLNDPKSALAAYKEVLFLSPSDAQAIKAVETWDYQEAEEFKQHQWPQESDFDKQLITSGSPENVSGYIEALIARNELKKAQSVISVALSEWPQDALLKKQREVVNEFVADENKDFLKNQLKETQISIRVLKSILNRRTSS